MRGKPDQHRRTLCMTFDNLGEAAEIDVGLLPADTPTGAHISVIEGMPKVLAVLKKNSIKATFFFEGWNADKYPDVLKRVVDEGHEVAVHVLCHENWAEVESSKEEGLIVDAFNAFRDLGIDPVGFRPPGGEISPQTETLLAAQGATYISPVAHATLTPDRLNNLPFSWTDVDAFWLEPLIPHVRKAVLGGDGEIAPLSVWEENIWRYLDPASEQNHPVQTLIFHPYLLALREDHFASFERFVEELAGQVQIEVARCRDLVA